MRIPELQEKLKDALSTNNRLTETCRETLQVIEAQGILQDQLLKPEG